MAVPPSNYRFAVAFSFAGPHREKVRAIAELVRAKLGEGNVFFDEWFEHEILGPNMRLHLQRVYFDQSLLVLADLSDDYADRPWCQAENEAIDALRMSIDSARDETARLRLLNAKFGNGKVPGVLPNAGYLDATKKTVDQCADLILKRHALLVERMGGQSAPAPLAEVTAKPAPPIRFFHPATNDDRYSRREKELAWLDDCARDPDIRIATVTGQGGLGKTSLVGHWIEKHHGWQHRAFRGVFFYSFYSNRDPEAFFVAFLQFVCEGENVELPKNGAPLHHLAATACRRWCYLVVLDGLEVLQRDESDSYYGWINDGELNEFVARGGAAGQSLLVLTSRFPFPQITNENPHHARAKELPLLEASEGADLLVRCGLAESRDNLEAYSTQFGGHPLALRIFAGLCVEQPFSEPAEVSHHVCSSRDVETMPDPDEPGLSPEEKQKRRQRRQFYKLLRWFQQKLSPPKRRLLQLVALFREPVPTGTLAALAVGMDAMKADFAGCDATRITGLLDQLSGQFLLQKETSPADDTLQWTAHPIIRDVFREAALAAGDTVAKQFADIVAGKRGDKRLQTVAEVLSAIEAVEVLLAAKEFKAADALYRGRLENGRMFQSIPAPREGLRCGMAFLESVHRRTALETDLGAVRVGFYHNEVALSAVVLGELETAEGSLRDGALIAHASGSWGNLSRCFENLADIQAICGSLRESVATASEALFYAGVAPDLGIGITAVIELPAARSCFLPPRPSGLPPHHDELDMSCRACRANSWSLAGRLVAASGDFAAADTLSRKNHGEHAPLHSVSGIHWSRYRIRLGESGAARRLTEANRAICKRNSWNDDLAGCDLRLGELDFLAADFASAERHIAQSTRTFRVARNGVEIPDALLAMARLRFAIQLAQEDARRVLTQPVESSAAFAGDESALSYCEESLRLAARGGFLLKKCDALNFRALLLRESGQPEKALSDAKESYDIAQRCDYYWGLHEALRQLRDTTLALNRTAEFREWDAAEKALAAKMKPEIEEALRINREHDAEMERLYGGKKNPME